MIHPRMNEKYPVRVLTHAVLLLFGMLVFAPAWPSAAEWQTLPDDPYFAPFKPLPAPETGELLLKEGDRVAICGDSITEQKMYSRIMETYLTVCVPQLKITVRQYGWSGETAPGLLNRMENDVLRFHPTLATTCYGMNDHRYQPYNPEYGRQYEETSLAIIRKFKENGARVIQGSPGTVGKMPSWVKQAQGTVTDLNLSLLEFRNIGARLARPPLLVQLPERADPLQWLLAAMNCPALPMRLRADVAAFLLPYKRSRTEAT